MAADPKPVTATRVATAADTAHAPQPIVFVGGVPATTAEVAAALKLKTQIAALTSSSTAADIVAALKA